jgi:hypothetical protein
MWRSIMQNDLIYEERISSLRTEAVFVALSVLCVAMLAWRLIVSGYGTVAALLLFLSTLFVFYALNYRVLVVRMSKEGLRLKFGLFGWTVPWQTVARAYPDDTALWRIGGAGIHFSIIKGKCRAMLNFLEHPRIVVELKKKRGLVREVAFSTQKPDEILRIIEQSVG